jgi:NAD(P)-dependent dehydrogenase (short-subunit alcohol dehydrogenase family)
MSNAFENKTFVITGGSSGIGRATALMLDRKGATVFTCGRNEEKLSELKKYSKNIFVFKESLSSEKGVSEFANKILSFGAEINGFVHSAGVIYTEPFDTFRKHELEEMLEVNVKSGFYLLQKLLPKFPETGGSAVFVSSIDAYFGAVNPPSAGYALSKGALISLTNALASELGMRNIRVNAVVPGLIRTKMTEDFFTDKFSEERKKFLSRVPLGRAGTAEEVAKLILFLLSDDSSYISGDAIFIDGGYHVR